MGGLSRIGSEFRGGVLRVASSLLEDAEREAVLGDLAEERVAGWRAIAAVSGLASRRVVLRLRRGEALLPARAGSAPSDRVTAESWPEWVVPLAAGLIASTCVVALLVPPRTNTLTWPGVMSRSALLLAIAAAAGVGAVALLHRAYRDYFRRPGAALLACVWSSAIWVPLLLLVWSEHATWVVLTPIPIAGLVASFAKRSCQAVHDGDDAVEAEAAQIFDSALAVGASRVSPAALASACLLQMCGLAAAAGNLPLTCSLVILTTGCLAWAFTPAPEQSRRPSAAPVRARIAVLPCFLLTCLALTPFLRLGLGSSRLNSVVFANPVHAIPHVTALPEHVYSRVVLLAPPLPKRKLLMDPPKLQLGGVARLAHPLVIRFDGAYWYFQNTVAGAKYEVKVKRGDPTKGHIYSDDFMPLQMEAHQPLGMRLSASCCRSMSVALVNADTRLGLIQVEAQLRNKTEHGTETVSLGVVPVRSSAVKQISTVRPAVSEVLRFPIAGSAASFEFNEITLVFKLAHEREMAGAKVQVSSFTLEP